MLTNYNQAITKNLFSYGLLLVPPFCYATAAAVMLYAL